jgi:hypothetical protein
MVVLKSMPAGIAAVVLVAIASVFVMGVYLWVHRPPDTGADLGAVGWDPISLTKPGTWVVVVGMFLAGFFWEFLRATRR